MTAATTAAVRERYLLFKGPSVCAIRERRKTQTRRLTVNYGVGDRLWIREKWAREPATVYDTARVVYAADRGAHYFDCHDRRVGEPFYLPSDYEPAKWRPSIFMPCALGRVVLEVTALRREPLGMLTEADAFALGVPSIADYCAFWKSMHGADAWRPRQLVYVVDFKIVEDWPV